ncbi:sigma factor-like helix-turn-helix DNA-binding protein [Streptomyces sp. NPDC015346]|uniref:sigma factor-like helix-turn-helix DNA-binding protein n=1 Tax=Streptomyces sp. NPDC015346 TaxID=3364954 RepID=UPI0036FB6F1F
MHDHGHDHRHDQDFLTRRFDSQHERLRGIALRMLGSPTEADEALVEARAGLGGLEGWLALVVGRVCVARLRTRGAGGRPGRRERSEAMEEAGAGDSVWMALLVVLESLAPDERLAYVLRELFGLPLAEVGRLMDRTPEEAGRLARRASLRVRGPVAPEAVVGPGRQRAMVETFLAAARARDARTLAAVLDPEVVAYAESGPVHGAPAVAEGAAAFARIAAVARPALVDGAPGIVAFRGGQPVSTVAFTFRDGRIVALDITACPERLRALRVVHPES